MMKHPETLMIRTASGPQRPIGLIHSEIPNRIKVPIPPPIATNQYLRMRLLFNVKRSDRATDADLVPVLDRLPYRRET
jgi:hypothetical protein